MSLLTADKGTIIYIGGFELPDKNAAAHRVLNNAKIFREIGYNVVFMGIDKSLKVNEVKKTNVQGFSSVSIPYPASVPQWIWYLISTKVFRAEVKNYNDVKAVICYNYQSFAFLRLWNYCRKKRIKVIADCTEWYGADDKTHIFRIIKSFDSFLRMKIIQPRIDGNMVISTYLYNYYRPLNDNLILLPPLVDLDEEKWKQLPEVTDDKDGLMNLIYAGSPGAGKDQLGKIIETLKSIKEKSDYRFSLKVLGLTKEQFVDTFGDAENHSQIDFVDFKGRRPHIESLKEVAKADFQIIIRDDTRMTKAGFPTKLAESISCGTPLIMNPSSNITDYIKPGDNGFLLDTTNSQTLFKTLETALSQGRNSINRMKKICKESQTFDYRKYIEPTERFLHNVLNDRAD